MDSQVDNQQLSQVLPPSASEAKGWGWLWALPWTLLFGGLLFLSQKNYLLYHSTVEVLSVVVAVTIFSIGWNSKRFVQDNTLLVLAVSYLPIGALDFLHVLSYKGMGVFPDRGPDLPTQLWIAARYVESGALLWAATLLGGQRRLNHSRLLAAGLLAGALLFVLIVPLQFFPTCFVEGQGLTTFKVASEYLISALLAMAALVFWTKRRFLDRKILSLLIASVTITICSELSFTLYADVYGLFNFIGHVFKLVSVLLIYFALVQSSLMSPYQSLFRKLSQELAQRKASEEKLQAVNRELDAFAYTVSHDLRSSLTPIIGFADYLQEKNRTQLPQDSLTILQQIGDLGRGMSETMENLLSLAKLGRIEPPANPVSVEGVVDKVLIALGSRLYQAGLAVNKQALPEVLITESLLHQLFSNLLGNALNYGEGNGSIEVGGERRQGLVRFYVRDHGPGIPENERDRIFDLFYRGSGGQRAQGTGIGLAIVQKIARLYSGRAWVEETPGGGATFWVEMDESGGK